MSLSVHCLLTPLQYAAAGEAAAVASERDAVGQRRRVDWRQAERHSGTPTQRQPGLSTAATAADADAARSTPTSPATRHGAQWCRPTIAHQGQTATQGDAR